jgi:serine/threonine protein kinase
MHNDPLAVPSNSRQSVPEHLSACLQPALYTQPQTIVVISYQPACAQAWIVACQQCVCPVLCCTHTHIASASLQVVRLLGTGGEGETWLCIDQRNKQEVAIKLVRRPIPRSITQIIQVCAMNTEVQGRGGVAVARLPLGRESRGAARGSHQVCMERPVLPSIPQFKDNLWVFLGGGGSDAV